MDAIKKNRRRARLNLTKIGEQIIAEANLENPDASMILTLVQELDHTAEAVVAYNKQMEECFQTNPVSESDEDEEITEVRNVQLAYLKARGKAKPYIEAEVERQKKQEEAEAAATSSRNNNNSNYDTHQVYTLPKIDVPVFSGEHKHWLKWWAQFRRIHEDARLSGGEKFNLLLQGLPEGTRARSLVDKYHVSDSNYPKVIEALEERFGDTDTLIDLYVRELQMLMINNIMSKNDKSKERITARKLFDDIESSLNALNTLGTIDKSQWLFPIIESSLPYGLMMAWQQSPHSKPDVQEPGKTPRNKLDRILDFLKEAAKHEDRRVLATEGFKFAEEKPKEKESNHQPRNNNFRKGNGFQNQKKNPDPPAVMGLVAMNADTTCIFCGKHSKSHKCRIFANKPLQDKKRRIEESGACFRCLEKGHRSSTCNKEIKCSNANCGSDRHHTIMCPGPAQSQSQVPPPQGLQQVPPRIPLFPAAAASNQPGPSPNSNIILANFGTSPDALLPTLMLGAQDYEGTTFVARAGIDTFSGHTYATKKFIQRLRIPPIKTQVPFKHSVFGGGVRTVMHDQYLLNLTALDWNYALQLEIYDQDQIAAGIPGVPSQEVVDELKQYGIKLHESSATEIDILIGIDVIAKIFTGQQFQLKSGLMAIQTKFGWTVMGRPITAQDGKSELVEHTLVNLTYPSCIWELDVIGIEDNAQKLSRAEEDAATMEHFRRTVSRKEDGRYQVALPWISEHPPLLPNRGTAEKRLFNATKKLREVDLFDDYEQIFEEWRESGIISEVEGDLDEEGVHLLSHRPVIKPTSSTTKVRPVFDASCRPITYGKGNVKIEHLSLNDCLVKGPNLLDQIPNLLLRFREDLIAAIADIRKAFLMIEIKYERDRKVLRFIWWRRQSDGTYRIFQHHRVVFGVNCSPFLLNAVIEHHLKYMEQFGYEVTIKKLRRSLYVDNVAASFPDQVAYEKFRNESVEILDDAKFDLRLWESNCDENIGPEPSGVLGIKWDRLADQLYCDVLPEPLKKTVTKKTILSAIARVYDPLGMLSPVVLVPKLLLQRCWDLKLKWDEEVPADIKQSFEVWLEEMEMCTMARIPRYIGVPTAESSMHVFCDASFSGFAAVVYLRHVKDGNVAIKFVMCRARVAPIKKITINRLELIGCEIASRLAETVREALEWRHVPTYFWTDSTTAKAWIERNNDWGTFVHNRVKKIRAVVPAENWHHVPGDMNPADLPSRGCGMKEFLARKWLDGPAWLAQEPCYWPGGDLFYDEKSINAELKKSAIVCCNFPMDEPWYSTWKCRLGEFRDIIRMIGWMIRFKFNCKASKEGRPRRTGQLSFEEIRKAESRLFYMVQRETNLNPKKLPIETETFEEDELLRAKTKLLLRDDTEDFKYPVILPGKHYLVELLIRQEHLLHHHAGVQFLLANLRERVWIIGGRRAATNVVQSCWVCRRFTANHLDPVTAPLPENRVRDASPFEITGIDFAGPLFLKGKKKTWVALFTCAVYRAVHLELVDHMDTESFLLSLRKFIARRGRPSVIYSDNGTNFVGANNDLKEVDWEKVASDRQCQPIHWHFNPPSSPWWGGFFERLVRTTKELLVRNLGLKVLTKEELSAVMCDIEATINGRPLTYVFEGDSLVPLTPALFLYGPRGQGVPDLDQLDSNNANRRLRIRQEIMENLRERFRKEYLGQLVQRRHDAKDVELQVGDVVLIGSENVKRCMWPTAVVMEIIEGVDGGKRVFKLRTKTGELIRTAQRLYPLELTKSYLEKAPEKVQENFKTRAGRTVKIPKRFQ